MSPLAGKETWHSLPTTPAILSTATKYFDRAAYENHSSKRPASVTDTFSLKGVHLWELWLLLFFQRKIGTPPSRFPGVLAAMSVYRAKKIILMQALVMTMLMVRCSLLIFFAGLHFTRMLSFGRIPGNTVSGNLPIYLMALI